MILTMAPLKRGGRKKQAPIISNTGFIGSVFIDTLELQKKSYYFARKKLQIVHHVLDGLSGATSALFKEHNISAYMSCVYLHKQKKIGFVLSTKPFEQSDGIAYFVNYLIEKNFYGNDEEVEYQEVFNTGFIGVVFADLCSIDRFNFEFEMGMLTKLMKDMIIPVKELFLRHNVPAYISTSHLEEQNKLGFVLSVKPYDERAEADLYFEAYLKERGLFIGDEEDDIDKIVIRKTAELR
ncbi:MULTISPECIES: hypothetical protein [Bacillus]|uniref:hypothetical protein n=1 Tax=Bacillus TaxID=1386 RepID=UPI00288C8591|nr:hypothetical protein [Bacillus cereus]HDX9645570.1 hypothetical protein [Bacillus cereus]